MNQKVVFLVVLVGLVLAFLGIKATFFSTSVDNSEGTEIAIMVDVWRANTILMEGEFLSADKLEHLTMTQSEASSAGFNGSQSLPFNQQAILSQQIEIGAEIKASDVVLPGDPRYVSLLLPKNKLAYPLTIDSKQFIANGLMVGDHVDVFIFNSPDVNTVKNGFASHRNLAIKLLLSNIKLLSVPILNVAIEPDSEVAIDKNINPATVDILIELNKEEAMRLALAEKVAWVDIMPFTETVYPLSIRTEDLIDAIKEERRESVRVIHGLNASDNKGEL